MASRNFPRIVYPRTDGDDPASRSPGSPVAAKDALLILADIIEDMLNEASGHRRPVPDTDGAA